MGNRILCIDDNPDNLMLVKRILEASGYEILRAANGQDGLAIADNQPIDLVLLDGNLPDVDGYEVVRRLRASPRYALASVPIIMVSANALKADAQKAFSAGCNLYMTKPIDINEFSSQVGFYLGREAQS